MNYCDPCFNKNGYPRRVSEYNEYGDLDMMNQYVKDIQSTQRKIQEISEMIDVINEVYCS